MPAASNRRSEYLVICTGGFQTAPRRPVLLPVAGGDDRGPQHGHAVQRRVQARDRERAADAPGRGVLLRPRHAGAVAGAARVRARRARHAGARHATTGRSTAATSRAPWPASSRSRCARVRIVRLGRARVHARHRQTTMAAGGVDRAPRSCRTSSSRSSSASRRSLLVAYAGARPHLAARRSRSAASAIAAHGRLDHAAARQQAYTQSMRYTKLIPTGDFKLWSWLPLPGPIRTHDRGLVRAWAAADRHERQPAEALLADAVAAVVDLVARRRRDRRRGLVPPALDARVAGARTGDRGHVRANGPSTRSGTRVSCRSGCCRGDSSRPWARPRSAWLAASSSAGATRGYAKATCRTRAPKRGPSSRRADDPDIDPEVRKEAAWALAERRFDADPAGWEPPERLAPERVGRRQHGSSARSRSPW